MDFWETMRVLRRRWYIALPALLVSGILAMLTYTSVPTRYESTGVLVLTSPSSGGRHSDKTKPEDVVRVNPLLAFDSSLTTTAQILTQVLGDPTTHAELAGEKSTSVYTANTGPVGGPLLFVTAESDTGEQAKTLVGKIMERAAQELDTRQRTLNAPEPTFITSQVLVKPTAPQAKIGGKVRFVGAAAVVLLLLTIAVTFGSDSVLGKLKRRREAAAAEKGDDDTPPQRPDVRPPPPPAHRNTRNGTVPHVPAAQRERLANQATVVIAAPKPDPLWPTSEDPHTR